MINLPHTLIGFESLLRTLENIKNEPPVTPSFPPYNIVRHDEIRYTIELAVAGFSKDDLKVSVSENVLTVKGKGRESLGPQYIHRGISYKGFSRSFTLADTVHVMNVDYFDGMLKIDLENIVPEHKRPREIPINEKFLSRIEDKTSSSV